MITILLKHPYYEHQGGDLINFQIGFTVLKEKEMYRPSIEFIRLILWSSTGQYTGYKYDKY